MKKNKKIISIALVCLLVLSSLPAGVFAKEEQNNNSLVTTTETNEENTAPADDNLDNQVVDENQANDASKTDEDKVEEENLNQDSTKATLENNSEKKAKASSVKASAIEPEVNTVPKGPSLVSGTSKWVASIPNLGHTTDGILVDVDKTNAVVTYTIPKDFNKDEIKINAVEDVLTALHGTYMPGDSKPFTIKIINKSLNVYNYKQDSFKITTEDLNQYNTGSVYSYSINPSSITKTTSWNSVKNSVVSKTSGFISGAKGFDGSAIDSTYSPSRTANSAIKYLYSNKDGSIEYVGESSFSSNNAYNNYLMSDKALGERLKKAGYSGINDLAQYYLDYYNNKYNLSVTKLEDFSDKIIAEIFSGNRFESRETNVSVAELGYNFFYNKVLSVNPTTVGGYSDDYAIGKIMRDGCGYEDICRKDLGSIDNKESGYSLTAFEMNVSGPNAVNAYMNYNFGFFLGFSLIKEKTPTIQITKDVLGLSEEQIKNLDLKFELVSTTGYSKTITLADGTWNGITWTSKEIDVEPGTYFIKAEDGANITGYSLTANLGDEVSVSKTDPNKTINITNSYTEVKGDEDGVSFDINKIDAKGKAVSGAEFSIYKVENGEEIFLNKTKGTGSSFAFNDLTSGEYRVYETKVPTGYKGLKGYFEVSIKDSGDIYLNDTKLKENESIDVINTKDGTNSDVLGSEEGPSTHRKTDNPKTGDNSALGGYLLLFALGGLGLTSTGIYIKKRKSL